MKISTTAGDLAAALIQAGRIVEHRNTIPVLGHVLLSAGDDGLRLRATDMECYLELPLPGTASEPGAMTVDGRKRLRTLCCAMPPASRVELDSAVDGKVAITSATMTATMDSYPPEDFPATPDLPEQSGGVIMITAGELLRAIQAVRFAISTEETRYYLNGICFELVAGKLTMIATDGHRLMSITPELRQCKGAATVIVPRKTIDVLAAMLPGLNDAWPIDLTLYPESGKPMASPKAAISAGVWRLVTKCIDGTFPEWRRVVPKADDLLGPIIVREPEAFSATLGALMAGRSNSQPIRFIQAGDGVVALRLKDDSDSEELLWRLPTLSAEWREGPEAPKGGFQLRYLADVCRGMPDGFELRQHKTGEGPTLISGRRVIGAIMPMKSVA